MVIMRFSSTSTKASGMLMLTMLVALALDIGGMTTIRSSDADALQLKKLKPAGSQNHNHIVPLTYQQNCFVVLFAGDAHRNPFEWMAMNVRPWRSCNRRKTKCSRAKMAGQLVHGGGTNDKNGESVADVCVREAREEMGISLDKSRLRLVSADRSSAFFAYILGREEVANRNKRGLTWGELVDTKPWRHLDECKYLSYGHLKVKLGPRGELSAQCARDPHTGRGGQVRTYNEQAGRLMTHEYGKTAGPQTKLALQLLAGTQGPHVVNSAPGQAVPAPYTDTRGGRGAGGRGRGSAPRGKAQGRGRGAAGTAKGNAQQQQTRCKNPVIRWNSGVGGFVPYSARLNAILEDCWGRGASACKIDREREVNFNDLVHASQRNVNTGRERAVTIACPHG